MIKIVLVGKKVARKWLWRDSWAMTRTSTWSSVAGSVRYSHAIVQLGRSGWNTICQAGKSIVFCSWLSFLFIMAALSRLPFFANRLKRKESLDMASTSSKYFSMYLCTNCALSRVSCICVTARLTPTPPSGKPRVNQSTGDPQD